MSEDNYVSDEDLALLESIKEAGTGVTPPKEPAPDFSGNLNVGKLQEIFNNPEYQDAMAETDGSAEETGAVYDQFGVPPEARLPFAKKQS